MQNSVKPRGSPRIMIRYFTNNNALSKDFTSFCDDNCKNRAQAMVNENVGCTFYIPSNMQRLKLFSATFLCSYGYLIDCCKRQ